MSPDGGSVRWEKQAEHYAERKPDDDAVHIPFKLRCIDNHQVNSHRKQQRIPYVVKMIKYSLKGIISSSGQ